MSGDADFREMCRWYFGDTDRVARAEVTDFDAWSAEIERLYREAHPPKVTAEDVIFEARWDMGNFGSSLASGVKKDECRANNDYRHSGDLSAEEWHATLLHVAKSCADLRNAAREEPTGAPFRSCAMCEAKATYWRCSGHALAREGGAMCRNTNCGNPARWCDACAPTLCECRAREDEDEAWIVRAVDAYFAPTIGPVKRCELRDIIRAAYRARHNR